MLRELLLNRLVVVERVEGRETIVGFAVLGVGVLEVAGDLSALLVGHVLDIVVVDLSDEVAVGQLDLRIGDIGGIEEDHHHVVDDDGDQ